MYILKRKISLSLFELFEFCFNFFKMDFQVVLGQSPQFPPSTLMTALSLIIITTLPGTCCGQGGQSGHQRGEARTWGSHMVNWSSKYLWLTVTFSIEMYLDY